MTQLALGVRLADHAVFDNFLAGANAQALTAVQALAQGRPEPVIWLWGQSAVGKSHLLQAACAACAHNGRTGAYLPLSQWRAEGPRVLAGWEDYQLVCLDDLDAVLGDGNWEQVLFTLFNALRERGGSILAAARTAPAASGISLADLASRLASGPVFRLIEPDENQRLQALALRASRRGLVLPDDSARWLIRHYRRDLKSLFELLETLDLASLAAQRRLTLPFVREIVTSTGSANGEHKADK